MRSTSAWRDQAPVYLAGAAAAASGVSIAASQILLGLAFIAVIAAQKWRWPPVVWPVVAWMTWTLVSLAASGHARGGFPQVKKFYVWLMLFVVFSALRSLKEVRLLVIAWVVAAAVSSMWGFEQFAHKYLTTPKDFYIVYQGTRITGFVDHWMTFSGLCMMTLMLLGALLFFSRSPARWRTWLLAAGVLIGTALVLAYTKTMWVGAAAGVTWLLWSKNKWLAAPLPVAALMVLLLNPFHVLDRDREHRAALREVGWAMIQAHPLVGVGPEQVGPQFLNYLPADIPRPVPVEWYYQHLHNIYFHFAAERGLPALAALLWFLGQSLLDFLRTLRRLPPDSEARWILHGVIAATIAVLVSGWGEVNLGDSEVLGMFLAVIACGYIALQSSRSDLQRA